MDWEQKYAVKNLSDGTLETYKLHLKNHILPKFGHFKLNQVKPIHVVSFLDEIKRKEGREEPISVSTIAYIYRVLRNVFEHATEWQLIKSNPVALVKKPKENNYSDVNVYSEAEIEQLFNAVQDEMIHWRVYTSLALAAGLRRGELLGLEWKNVDLINGTIYINQVISRGENGRPTIKEPKTKKSKRIISLPQSVIEELKSFQLHWRKRKLRMNDIWIEKDREWLFCNEDGTHFYPTTPTTWWKRFINRTGIRFIRLHDLRHSSATLLINQGVHAKIISERL